MTGGKARLSFITRSIAWLKAGALLLPVFASGCGDRSSRYYPVPAQVTVPPAVTLRPVSLLRMSDIDVEKFTSRGVGPPIPDASWRWSDEHPMFHFPLTAGRQYAARFDFSVAEVTYKDTGPVTVTLLVNGHTLARKLCEKPGDYLLEADVPPEWLATEEALLNALIDPYWKSPGDGKQLGVILKEVGFVQK
jgi:hypothetical protein